MSHKLDGCHADPKVWLRVSVHVKSSPRVAWIICSWKFLRIGSIDSPWRRPARWCMLVNKSVRGSTHLIAYKDRFGVFVCEGIDQYMQVSWVSSECVYEAPCSICWLAHVLLMLLRIKHVLTSVCMHTLCMVCGKHHS